MSFDQVYQPEADTFLLLKAVLREVRQKDRVLEVGTGSGFIASKIAGSAREVVATDINPHAVAAAKKKGVDVVRTDLAAGIRGLIDLVAFNPPYLPTAPEERIDDWLECALDGGPDGRAVIERFATEVGRVLAPYGRILILVSSLTDLAEVKGLFTRQGFISFVVSEEKIEGEVLYVLRVTRDLCGMRV